MTLRAAGDTAAPLVALTGVEKHFGAVRALSGVSVSIESGECLGLIGHNGAGKSTLVNIVNGGLAPSGGSLSFPASGAASSMEAGVRSVFQELSLCPNLTVAENLAVAHTDLGGMRWRPAARAEIRASLDAIFPGHKIAADTEVDLLSIAERQMVEIAIGFAPRGSAARLRAR